MSYAPEISFPNWQCVRQPYAFMDEWFHAEALLFGFISFEQEADSRNRTAEIQCRSSPPLPVRGPEGSVLRIRHPVPVSPKIPKTTTAVVQNSAAHSMGQQKKRKKEGQQRIHLLATDPSPLSSGTGLFYLVVGSIVYLIEYQMKTHALCRKKRVMESVPLIIELRCLSFFLFFLFACPML